MALPLFASRCLASPLFASRCSASPLFASRCLASPLFASRCLASPLFASLLFALRALFTRSARVIIELHAKHKEQLNNVSEANEQQLNNY